MPRKPLFVLTTLVLALHWLVLQGMPMAWDNSPSAAPAALIFRTRSIAPKPPSAAPAAPPAPPAPLRPAAVRTKPAAPLAGQPTARTTAEAQPTEPPTPSDPPSATAEAPPADPAANTTAAPTAEAPEKTEVVANATAPEAIAPGMAPPTASDNSLGAGVVISPPGGTTGPASGAAALAVHLPAPVRLAFDVSGQAKKFHYNAHAELLWQHDGSRYEARQEISAFLVGTRSQSSVGHITAQGLQPERFADRSRSEQAAHFDHAQGRVTFSANTPTATIGPGAQDRLSVFIQLGALLAADPGRFVPGTQITLTTASARSADRWTFSIEGQETLDLPAGPTLAWKLLRLPRRDYDQKAELWLAPELGYVPVRIRLTQANGDFADLRLRSSGPP